MAVRFKRITRNLFIILNTIAAVLYLLACLAPKLDPAKWWPVSMLALAFAVFFAILISFIFFWLIFRPKFIFISLVPLLIGWKPISVFFAVNTTGKFDYSRDSNTLRVASWNVARFVEWKRNNNRGSRTRLKMMDLLKEQNADILCLQEFFTSADSVYYDNLNHLMKELGYPYYYYSWDDDGYLQWVGEAIFSKLPLIDSGMIRYSPPSTPKALIYIDVLHGNDTIRIFTTHLQSVQFRKQDFETIDKIRKTEEAPVRESRTIFGKLKRGVIRRSFQAREVRRMITSSPYPFILTGDFNDVPNSYTYHAIVQNELRDVFLEKGFGVGRTYLHISPNLRIDYILTSRDFSISQFNRVLKHYSDHYMLVADLELNR